MKTVEAYIMSQPPEAQKLLRAIRRVILDCAPGITEKISYGIPFFQLHANMCYIFTTREGVETGFTQGCYLSDTHPRLEKRNRKVVKSVLIRWNEKATHIEAVLLPILREAVVVNEWKAGKTQS